MRAIGASNYTRRAAGRGARRSAEGKGLPRYESLQPHYNLVDARRYEGALEPLCLQRARSASSPTTRWPAAS